MNAKELRSILEASELSQSAAARALDIDPRTMRRYIAGDVPIPQVVELAIREITRSWSTAHTLREVNSRLRHVCAFAEEALQKISDGTGSGRNIADNALDEIIKMRARWF